MSHPIMVKTICTYMLIILFINIAQIIFGCLDFYVDSCTKDLLKFIDPKTVKSMAEFVRKKKIPIPKSL